MKRKHQVQFENLIDEIVNSSGSVHLPTVLLKVTPGGGKSMIPIIAGKLITHHFAKGLCWISPRKSLQSQGESNFLDPRFREMFGHDLSIRSSTNDTDPCRDLDGFITTYQAISQDDERSVEGEFTRRGMILVLDEFHHVEQGGVWHKALEPLVRLCSFLVLMSGTLERGDGNRIAFIPYTEGEKGLEPDLRTTDNFHVIDYSRTDALEEKAIIPLHFTFHDGSATWENDMGTKINVSSLANVKREDNAAAVYTALSTEYSQELLRLAVNHWQNHRMKNPRAKLLVITANKTHADNAIDLLKRAGFNAEIATSHASEEAHRAILNYKLDRIDILVTIAMAYEGLDVPAITHEVVLTHIRSTPWIEQMLARANRVDPAAGPYESQRAYIFAPDDPVFRKVVERIRAEQLPYVSANKQMELFEDPAPAAPREKECWMCDFYETEHCMGFGWSGEICDQFKNEYNPLGIKPLASSLSGQRDLDFTAGKISEYRPVQKTPKQQEEELRKKIENHVRLYSFNNRHQDGEINRQIYMKFQKARAVMTIPELQTVLDHVEKEYPLNKIVRGTGRRTTTKVTPWEGSIPVYGK